MYVYICASCVCLLPEKTRRGHQFLWNWSYRWRRDAYRAGIEPGSPGSALLTAELPPQPPFKMHFKLLCVVCGVRGQAVAWPLYIHVLRGFWRWDSGFQAFRIISSAQAVSLANRSLFFQKDLLACFSCPDFLVYFSRNYRRQREELISI